MFKDRLLQIFRKFWKTESFDAAQDAAAEPVDLQTRLQHVSELYPCAEPCIDTDHVQMHEVEMCEIDLATELEIALGSETSGLNHWAAKRKKTTSSDNLKAKRLNFSYEIDPGRSPSKASHDNLNKLGPASQSIHEDIASLTERELIRNHDMRRDFELLRDHGAPVVSRVPERDPKFHSNQPPISDAKPLRAPREEKSYKDQHEEKPPRARPEKSQRDSRPAAQPAPLISDAAIREMNRLESANKAQISRSLSGFHDEDERDTVLADKWDCSEYNSLFALPDESRYGTTTEYEEDYEEDLLPYFTETLLMQEEELVDSSDALQKFTASSTTIDPVKHSAPKQPAAGAGTPGMTGAVGATESSTALQPYKAFSENALKLIAQKPETPAPTLKWLASHTNPHIRAAVAKNPSTPGDTITVLAKDHEAGIRHSIAENPLSSMDALNLLVKDRNPLIAWRAQNTVSQIREAQKAAQKAKDTAMQETEKEAVHHVKEAKIATTEETIAFLQVIARKTNTPARRLDDLARHADARVRAAVAENANAPAEILWILAKDADSSVKTKVTDNYNCPIEILEAMKEDEDAYVAYQAHSVLNRILGATFSDNHLRTATWP
ncbi:MAG: hypothetical protein JST89_26140 [Cyanobacteria bacterium SZAS-4]|nr:hypothetical protein [Cyanobacteria bacterium SZAS-4]